MMTDWHLPNGEMMPIESIREWMTIKISIHLGLTRSRKRYALALRQINQVLATSCHNELVDIRKEDPKVVKALQPLSLEHADLETIDRLDTIVIALSLLNRRSDAGLKRARRNYY